MHFKIMSTKELEWELGQQSDFTSTFFWLVNAGDILDIGGGGRETTIWPAVKIFLTKN